ncbi:similar to Saccharomyces cerevisiae YGR183C QCR9 Subunit 9 of the ubiquinol cytochrome-c reductase complex,which is a component of the mitochondrial inner membrane electron transport chain [Geotrichum candidum]|uniref:Complex III subunit 9 n=1 Tax=Geotrichum candidum TaxID=1173061 RepID=A0A0J9XJL8_GEOCN|nr:similar to Saccharomyces cerevisiae YGR183C QCR9 Subunit 9 of the ubiquinol cytochrome-c reductase complex,which is a component of the mitochondrial inner membrane electron transport chain [Geotrichum candidum]
MSFGTTIYNTLFRRNSVFVATVFASSFFFDIGFNKVVDSYYDSINAGKQWKDIRSKYVEAEDDDE